jgi:hypothetical protein
LRQRTRGARRAHSVRLIDGRRACDGACIHQVARDLGLAIDSDGLAGQGAEINALAAAAEADLDTVMDQTLAVEAGAHAGAVEEIDETRLDHAGTDMPMIATWVRTLFPPLGILTLLIPRANRIHGCASYDHLVRQRSITCSEMVPSRSRTPRPDRRRGYDGP